MTCSRVPRPVQQDAHPHEGTIVTDRIDDVWDEPLSGRQWLRSPIVAPSVRARWATVRATAGDGPRTMANDMTQTVTTGEGRAFGLSLDWVAFDASLFIAVDHCSGEFIGTHASSSASRWEALEPVRQGVTQPFGGVGPDVAKGLTLRHDHGSNYMADDFRREIGCFGILSSPAFVRQPEGNGRDPHPQGATDLGAALRDGRGAAAGAGRLRSRAQRFMAPPAPQVQNARSDQG